MMLRAEERGRKYSITNDIETQATLFEHIHVLERATS